MRSLTLLLALFCTGSALAEAPIQGDAANGAALFKVSCASCHGAAGRGSAGVPSLRDPAFLAAHSDEELALAIVKGAPSTGSSGAMPSFPRFPELDRWDLLAYLRQGEPRVADYFPNAALFTAQDYKLDKYARLRATEALGRPLTAAEGALTVVTFYGQGNGGAGPRFVEQDPVSLDKLKPKEGVGYLVFVELPRGDGHGTATYGLALDREGKLLAIASYAGLVHPAFDRAYQPYVGMGHKGKDAALKPAKGRAPPARLAIAFNRAFVRALEAVTMADKDERDRHWADQK